MQDGESQRNHTPAMTCHSLNCGHIPCSLGLYRVSHQGRMSYPFNTSGKKIAHPVCWLLSGVTSPPKFAGLPQTSTTVTKSPRICNGNTLLGDLAVFVPRARHGWSGNLRLIRNPFRFCRHGILAFCSNDAERTSAASKQCRSPGRFCESALLCALL